MTHATSTYSIVSKAELSRVDSFSTGVPVGALINFVTVILPVGRGLKDFVLAWITDLTDTFTVGSGTKYSSSTECSSSRGSESSSSPSTGVISCAHHTDKKACSSEWRLQHRSMTSQTSSFDSGLEHRAVLANKVVPRTSRKVHSSVHTSSVASATPSKHLITDSRRPAFAWVLFRVYSFEYSCFGLLSQMADERANLPERARESTVIANSSVSYVELEG